MLKGGNPVGWALIGADRPIKGVDGTAIADNVLPVGRLLLAAFWEAGVEVIRQVQFAGDAPDDR
jgi:hypothetical protein